MPLSAVFMVGQGINYKTFGRPDLCDSVIGSSGARSNRLQSVHKISLCKSPLRRGKMTLAVSSFMHVDEFVYALGFDREQGIIQQSHVYSFGDDFML